MAKLLTEGYPKQIKESIGKSNVSHVLRYSIFYMIICVEVHRNQENVPINERFFQQGNSLV